MCDLDGWLSDRVSTLQSVVAGSIPSGGDHGIHSWRDLIRSKQLSSGSVCRALVYAGFSGHGNSIHNLIPLLKKNRKCISVNFVFGICSLKRRNSISREILLISLSEKIMSFSEIFFNNLNFWGLIFIKNVHIFPSKIIIYSFIYFENSNKRLVWLCFMEYQHPLGYFV